MNIKEKKADFCLLIFKNLVLHYYYPHRIYWYYTDSNHKVNNITEYFFFFSISSVFLLQRALLFPILKKIYLQKK